MLTGGSVISGASGNRYRIEWYLTEGATATTYQAVDEASSQPVIVKALNLGGDSRVADAFWREGEVLEELARAEAAVGDGLHNVPRVLDQQRGGGVPFMVLELLSGLPLETLLERQPFLPEPEVMVVADQVLRVLALLHNLPRTMLSVRAKDIWLQRRADGTIHHVNMVDWKHVSPRYSGPLPRDLEIKDLARVARLIFWMTTGHKLETSPLPEDELAQRAGQRWSALSKGTRQLLTQSLSPDPSQRFRTMVHFRRAIQNQQGVREPSQGIFYQYVGQGRRDEPPAPPQEAASAPETAIREEAASSYPAFHSGASTPARSEESSTFEDDSTISILRKSGASSIDQEAMRAAVPPPPAEAPRDKELVAARRYSSEEREVKGFHYEPTIVTLREELVDALAEVQREHEQALQALRQRQAEEMAAARAEYELQVGGVKGRLGEAVERAEQEHEEAVLALRRHQAEQLAASQQEHDAAMENLRRQQSEAIAAMQREHDAAMEALRHQQGEALTAAQSQPQAQATTLPTSLHDDVLLTLDHLTTLLKELEYQGLNEQLGSMRAEIETRLQELQPVSGKEEAIPTWLGASAPEVPVEAEVAATAPPEEPPADAAEEEEEEEEPPVPLTPQELDAIRAEMEDLLWGSFPEIPKLTPEALSEVETRFGRARELLGRAPDPVFQAKLDRGTRLLTYLTRRQDASMMGRLKQYPDFHDFIDNAPEGETALQWVQANSVLEWMERARRNFEEAQRAMVEGEQSRAADLLAGAFALSRMVEHTIVWLWQQFLPEESYELTELNAFQAEVQRAGRRR